MIQQKSLVFIGAHPDDETFGMGATLAKYAREGVKVYYICATRGEAGDAYPEYMKGYADASEMRSAELKAAAQVLGLTGVIHLGYRDSGMPGTADNQNPRALIQASVDEVAEKIIKILLDIKPQVIITHDPSGGYQHPDHIATHKAAVKAFNDLLQMQSPIYQPRKLYFGVRSHRVMKLMIKLMPLFGQNPHQFGRNKDIDLTKIVEIEYPIHAFVRLSRRDMETRTKAAACHASQGGGRPPGRGRGLLGLVNTIIEISNRLFGYKDYFMRAYPAPQGKRREADLFEGI
jgi:N-acetyl-1-D-myo-inositol-2-amino-2-deoxy-alpha-D-glucopyranoside deacetylase